METVLLIIHILVCFFIITAVLMQASKGGGLAGAFGGAGGQAGAMFGGAGAGTFLSKLTTWLAVAFFLTCIGLWHFSRSTDTLPETAAVEPIRKDRRSLFTPSLLNDDTCCSYVAHQLRREGQPSPAGPHRF